MSNYKYNSSSCVITKLISKDILKIFEFISFGVALFDDAKRLVYYNKTLRNMLNATCVDNMSDLIMNLTNSKMLRKGSSFSPIHSPISRIGKICDLLDKLRSEDMEQHCEFITEDKTIWVKGKLIILNEEVKYIITFADVTLQRECEMLKEINKLKSKIISSLSHEFRNPLHNILDSLNNCQKEPSELKQNIRIANSNAHIMLYKVNDLLDYLQAEIDDIKIDQCCFDLRNEIQNVFNLLSLQSSLRNQALQIKFDDDLPKMITSDPNRIKQVLFNLLSNAINNTKENGNILISITRTKLINLKHAIQIEVSDNGVGISPESLSILFNLKEKESHSRRIAIGLPISYKICEKLGDGLVVDSKVGVGTKFSFTIEINCPLKLEELKENIKENEEYPEVISKVIESPRANRFEYNGKPKNIRARSLLHKLDQHPVPHSTVESEITSVKTVKKKSYLKLLSHEINQQLKIRSGSDPRGKSKQAQEIDKVRLKLQLQKVSGVASQLSKILRKDVQSVISDAILNKCTISQQPSCIIPMPMHHLPSSFIFTSERKLPIVKSGNDGFSVINEVMEVADEDTTSINHLPHPIIPKMLSKFPHSSVQVIKAKDRELINEFCLDKLVSKLAQRIKVCRFCKCPTILIVDDNDFIRFFLQKQLTKLGLTSDQAVNGQIAVEKVLEKGNCACKGYKLVFMDYDMPVLDGVRATKQIMNGVGKGKAWRDIVIVGVSAFSSKQDILNCMNAGMKDFSKRIM